MTLHCCRIALIVVVAAGAARAQNRTTEESNSPVVLEGCLQSAEKPGSLSGVAATTTAAANDIRNSPALFLLTGARPAGRPADAGASVGTAGQARTRNADGTVTTESDSQGRPKTYALFGDSRELAVHSGHRVEVSGTIVRSPAAAGEPASDRTTDGQRPAPGAVPAPTAANPAPEPVAAGSGLAERLNVTSIKTVADVCSQ